VNAVSGLIERLRGGDESVRKELTTTLYSEMHRIAARRLRGERPDHTLQTTALVHEAYLKLCGHSPREFTDRVHFLAVAAHVMRQVLIDHARARATHKRRGSEMDSRIGPAFEPGLDLKLESETKAVDLFDLNRALEALTYENEGLARLVEMRYFGGMTAEETAEALGKSVHVVRHDLHFAQAWLRKKLSQ
jgi:RNA polymerase sigma factor (TIGR02999 family)